MGDQFKACDSATVVGVVNFRHWSFALREVIVAFIALLAFIMCLIFIGLYAGASSKSNSLTGTHETSKLILTNNYCTSKWCLKTAARFTELMNSSVEPCENFYQFACGGYEALNPIQPNRRRTVIDDLRNENFRKVESLLHNPPKRFGESSYERKVVQFYRSCNSDFRRQKLGGRPFIYKVLPALGGWDVLGTWDEASWDFNTALKKVQSDFWVDAFYQPAIDIDPHDEANHVIALEPAGTSQWIYWSWYTSPATQKIRDDYKKFMRRVAFLLFKDADIANVTSDERESRITQFINDTFEVETRLSVIAKQSRISFSAYDMENRVSLSSLNSQTNSVINWVDQMAYLFNEATIDGNTKVVLPKEGYVHNMTEMIASLPATDRKRMLHNYLIWRVAEFYSADLSGDFVHANREIFQDVHGYSLFSTTKQGCMQLVRDYMKEGLSAMYVNSHLADESKEKITDITSNLRKALKAQLQQTSWMDATTKERAFQKLDAIRFKNGYPDWMTNQYYLDTLYMPMKVKPNDYFGNLLSLNQLRRKLWNKRYAHGTDLNEWTRSILYTYVTLDLQDNEVITSAGIMHPPFFHHNAPHYSNFGSLGSRIAKFMHHTTDWYGKGFWQDDETFDFSWWTANTTDAYRKTIWPCVVKAYANNTRLVRGRRGYRKFRFNNYAYANNAIATTSGVKAALIGYRDWMADIGHAEKMLPGISLTPEQMFFLSYAQSKCQHRSLYQRWLYERNNNLMEEAEVNTVLGELKEFTDVFQCPKDSKLNHETKCDYY